MYNEQTDEVIETLVSVMEKYLSDERLPRMTATYMWGLYSALKTVGFTPEQAMDIVTKQPIPSPKS